MVDRAARFSRARAIAAFLIGFTIPISTSISEIITVAAFVLLAIEGDWRRDWRSVLQKPVVRASLALFLLLGLALFYSTAPLPEAARFWIKYRELVYLPLFMLLCRDAPAARSGLWGVYGVVAAIIVLGDLGRFFHASLTHAPFGVGSVFGSYILEGVITALVAYHLAVQAILEPRRRGLWAAAAILAMLYVLCVSPGRTGILIIFALALLLLFQAAPRKLWLPGILAIALVGGAASTLSSSFGERIGGMVAGLQGSQQGSAAQSIGIRMTFYRISLATMLHHPVLGTGTGSFALEYEKEAQRQHFDPTRNPHNEYLMIGVQTGFLGVAVMLGLLATLWFSASSLPPADALRGRAVTLALALSCLFNSSLLDHVDGQAFFFQISLFYVGVLGREDQRHRHDL